MVFLGQYFGFPADNTFTFFLSMLFKFSSLERYFICGVWRRNRHQCQNLLEIKLNIFPKGYTISSLPPSMYPAFVVTPNSSSKYYFHRFRIICHHFSMFALILCQSMFLYGIMEHFNLLKIEHNDIDIVIEWIRFSLSLLK